MCSSREYKAINASRKSITASTASTESRRTRPRRENATPDLRLSLARQFPRHLVHVRVSGREYTVDLRNQPACTCPDFLRRDDVTACNHIRRAYVETGRVAIPAALDTNVVDDLLARVRRGSRPPRRR